MYHSGFIQPVQAAKARRARYPFFFEMGPITLLLVATLTLTLTALLYATKAGRVATSGYYIRQLEQQRDALQREREQLLLRAAELQNLSRIEREARRLGMVPAQAPEFVPGRSVPETQPAAAGGSAQQHLDWDVPLSPAWWERYYPALRARNSREGPTTPAPTEQARPAGPSR
jgi:cell division protein FtsL